MRLVLDTNVIVAGLRSPSGASAVLLDHALGRSFTLVLSVALALEYEAVCQDPAQRIASGLSEADRRDRRHGALRGRRARGDAVPVAVADCTTRPTRWCSTPPSTAPPTSW